MSTLLKNVYDKKYITTLATEAKKYYTKFNQDKFIKDIFNKDWKNKELKERLRHISTILGQHLPEKYPEALKVVISLAPMFGGYAGMFAPDFIEVYGLTPENKKKYWKQSISALKELTQYSSSEFAIRPFIKEKPKELMTILKKWSKDPNEHVRRLSSEGSRPRLPWAGALNNFKKDPAMILPILNNLKNDSSEYVRRSVANNMNDISKDHADLALKLAKAWIGKNTYTDKVVKHGLRTLLKAGAPGALMLFGYISPNKLKVQINQFRVKKKSIKLGDELSFKAKINVLKSTKIRLEYGLYFLRKNGEHNLKVFKINEKNYSKGVHEIAKNYSFKKISTRKYYKGPQHISLIVNGVEIKKTNFNLV